MLFRDHYFKREERLWLYPGITACEPKQKENTQNLSLSGLPYIPEVRNQSII
jgi:hypothetical protein